MPTIVSQNTIWFSGQTYNLTEDIQIADGATLTIQPGAIVNGNGYKIQTFGKLSAIGTAQSVITFNNTNFTFSANASDPGEITVSFSRLNGSTFLPATGNASYGKFTLSSSTIQGGKSMYIWYPVADSIIQGNVFIDAGQISVGTNTSAKVSILENTFYNIDTRFSTISNWAAYGEALIVERNNFFVQGVAVESPKGYNASKITATNNYFSASLYSGVSNKILDRSDDLDRFANIESHAQSLVPIASAPLLPNALMAGMLTGYVLRQSNTTSAYLDVLNIVSRSSSFSAAVDSVVKLADQTTSVATMSYQFFTGKAPSLSGLDYLISTNGSNPNNINSAYYQFFSLENRYINFSVNLGRDGEGKSSFTAKYGQLTLFEATREAYRTIFGSTPNDAKVHALIDKRVEYFAYYGKDGPEGLGTKAAMVGWLLAEAEKADLGIYAKSNAAFLADLADLADGVAAGIDIIGVYGRPEYAFLG